MGNLKLMQAFTKLASAVVICIGCIALFGWAINIDIHEPPHRMADGVSSLQSRLSYSYSRTTRQACCRTFT